MVKIQYQKRRNYALTYYKRYEKFYVTAAY